MIKISSELITKPSTLIILCYGLAKPVQALLQTFTSLSFFTIPYHTIPYPPFFTLIHRQLPMKKNNYFLSCLHLTTSLKWQIQKNSIPFTHHAVCDIKNNTAAGILDGPFTHWDCCYSTEPSYSPKYSKDDSNLKFLNKYLSPYIPSFLEPNSFHWVCFINTHRKKNLL